MARFIMDFAPKGGRDEESTVARFKERVEAAVQKLGGQARWHEIDRATHLYGIPTDWRKRVVSELLAEGKIKLTTAGRKVFIELIQSP